MKPLAFVLFFLLATSQAGDAPPGDAVGRWQIVAGEQAVVTDGGSITTKCFVRIDTATGRASWLRVLATGATDGIQLDWLPISEYVGYRPRTNPAPAPPAAPPWLNR